MKKRISNFELLRIIAMFMIVLHHAIVHGVWLSNKHIIMTPLVDATIYNFFAMGGEIGVYLFVMITGYFMIDSKIAFRKLVKLWLPIFFWSISLYSIFAIINHEFSLIGCVQASFPIISSQYWFITAYFLMYCLIPFLNGGINYMIRNGKSKYLILLVGIFLLLTFPKIAISGDVSSKLIMFCLFYSLGAFFKKENIQFSSKAYLGIALILNVIVIALVCIYGKKNLVLATKLMRALVLETWTIFGPVIAILGFITVCKGKAFYNNIINTISSTTLGVYLISDNHAVREWLWIDIWHLNKLSSSLLVNTGYILLAVVIVFVICSLLEYVRKSIFSRLEDYIINVGN